MTKSTWTLALAASAALLVGSADPATALTAQGARAAHPVAVSPVAASEAARARQGRPVTWADYEAARGNGHGGSQSWSQSGGQRTAYAEPVYVNTPVWRGQDGRNYCRKKDGTVGMIVGGAAGALLGREVDRGYNRTLGTILGAAGGALLGRAVDRNNSQCR